MSEHEQVEAVASRRRLLAGGAAVVGTTAGAVLLGAADAEAADGAAILAGRANTSTAATSLTNASTSGGAHGLLISTKGGYGFQATSATNHGVAGLTSGAAKAGVLATHNGPQGSGAALIANGRKNTGAYVYNSDSVKPALLVRTTRPNLPTPASTAMRVDAEGGFGTALEANGRVAITATSSNSALGVSSEGRAATVDVDAFTMDVNFSPVALRTSALSFIPEDPPLVADGYAIIAGGTVEIDGRLWTTTGGTRVINPTDPDVWLFQSFVEAPERTSVVNGVATTPASGEVTVTLPGWFVELTNGSASHRYQLTAHEAAMPNLHVKTTESGASFTIAGAVAGKVSWQVTGVRDETLPFAKEPEKERAKYPGWFRTERQQALRRGASEAKKQR